MKKYLLLSLFTLTTIMLLSWGYEGHRTVALIAERHLTPQAKAAVADLLDGQSIADVASWADEVRNQPEYKHTAPWHFLNEPTGLNESAFKAVVMSQDKENVYTAIQAQEKVLTDGAATKEQKAVALKFLVHFIGDLHQPMHISRAEDKGGNMVQVQFDGRGTNLHSLWDSKLLDHQGLKDAQLVEKLDHISPDQVRKWQSDNPLQWVWESYQISSKLYKGVEQNNKLDESYYTSHIGIVNERIEQAGIRLAGMLNAVFKNYKPSLSYQLANKAQSLGINPSEALTDSASVPIISLEYLTDHIGKGVETKGKVYDHKDMGSLVLVNVGAPYPNQLLTVVLRGEAKRMAATLDGKTISITGKVIDYNGKPEIEIKDVRAIEVLQVVGGSSRKGG